MRAGSWKQKLERRLHTLEIISKTWTFPLSFCMHLLHRQFDEWGPQDDPGYQYRVIGVLIT